MSDLQRMAEPERQKAELKALAKEAESDGDVVGRLSFKSRLNIVATEHEVLRATDTRVAEV
ncbi:hypothetical protein, partial [Pararhodobacter sp. SW119]|uniref:hypothetical protein n=1 Tax=Pararhodobacter sp. SW119 TaxID=2780075 RepID=UPI001AE0A532